MKTATVARIPSTGEGAYFDLPDVLARARRFPAAGDNEENEDAAAARLLRHN